MSRKSIRKHRQGQAFRSQLIWGGIALLAVAVVGFLVWNAFRPVAGQSVPIMGRGHIDEGRLTAEGYNSNPPTSGLHYATPLPAGFYQQAEAANLPAPPEGYLIFWYNSEALPDASDCSQLRSRTIDDGLLQPPQADYLPLG